MNIPTFSVKYPVTVAMIIIGIILLGMISLNRLGTDLLPDIHSPKIVINLKSGEKPPQEMEEKYAKTIEGLVSTVSNVRNVSSVSRIGFTQVTVEFFWDTDMDFAMIDIQKKVGRISSEEEVDELTVSKYDPQAMPIMTLGIYGTENQDLDEIRRISETVIKRELERLEGVAAISILGGLEKEIVVEINPYLLEAYSLALNDVVKRIQASNINASGGSIKDNEKVYIIKGVGEFNTLKDVENVTVGYKEKETLGKKVEAKVFSENKIPVLLKDIAKVKMEYKEQSSSVRINGIPCVGISIYKEAQSNTVRVIETIEKELDILGNSLQNIKIEVASDQAKFINSAINELKEVALYGIILAVIILYLFLRNIITTIIVSIAIPISIIATFNLMYFNDLTINIMTLGGLALGAGMLVDNSIVVVENIFRHRQLGERIEDASINGTSEVSNAIVASTITTIVVFLPIVFVHGIAGELFKEQAWTVTFSLLSSLLVALLLIPMLASRFLEFKGELIKKEIRYPLYWNLLGKILDNKKYVILATFLLLVLSIILIPQIGTEFIPKADQGQFTVNAKLPEGTKLKTTESVVFYIEKLLRDNFSESIDLIYSDIGRNINEEFASTEEISGENTATVNVILMSEDKRKIGTDYIIKEIDPLLKNVPDLEVNYKLQQSTLQQTIGTSSSPIIIEIKGPELNRIKELADNIVENIKNVPEIYNIETSFQQGRPEVNIKLDKVVAESFGLNVQQVAQVVKDKISGRNAGTYKSENEFKDIKIKYPEKTLKELFNLKIENEVNDELLLKEISDISIVEGPREVLRKEQSRYGLVTADIVKGFKFSHVINSLGKEIGKIYPPRDYFISITGEEEQRKESFQSLKFALIIAIVLVYMVLASLFESFVHPFTIMLTVPLAGMGSIFLFYFIGEPFSIMALIGLIMLMGICVNNSIILIDYINLLRKRGIERVKAVMLACQNRLRPILMTSLTTILALLPLSIGIGESAKLRAPLALAVIGGLATSTLLTLIVIPVIYLLIDNLFKKDTL
jgi:HAE1 family hydrophobic/amphiphilic exporter-1